MFNIPLSSKFLNNIDQRGTGMGNFNTENAIFENFPPEVMNFAKMKGFT